MGSSTLKIKEQASNLRKITNRIRMAFYTLEQPSFSMEHFHPGFYQPLRSMSRSRHWNRLEKLFDDEETTCQSSQSCCSSRSTKTSEEKSSISTTKERKMEVEGDKTNQENRSMEPATKTVSKRFMFKVSCQETLEKVEIKIQFGGRKFKAENLDVQVINDNVLVVKAENDEEKFERKFKLSSDTLVEKIESKFDVKEEDIQTLIINIPKDVKVIQVPIAMDE